MQKLDEKINYNIDKIKELIHELEEKEIITQIEAQNINVYKIIEFTKSNIWKELKKAKKIYREKPFFINISAKEVYNQDIEENILVQGIIDLFFFEDDKLILVDYKTDKMIFKNNKQIPLKYKEQLKYYKLALEKIFKKEVKEKYIYSFEISEEIRI